MLTAVRDERTMLQIEEHAKERSRMQTNSGRAKAGWLGLWLMALLAVGCSAPVVVPTQPVEAHQFQGKRGGVSVGVARNVERDQSRLSELGIADRENAFRPVDVASP